MNASYERLIYEPVDDWRLSSIISHKTMKNNSSKVIAQENFTLATSFKLSIQSINIYQYILSIIIINIIFFQEIKSLKKF